MGQTQMEGWTGAATSSKAGQKRPGGHQVLEWRLPRMWGTNGGKEAARPRQALDARMENRMMGKS